MRTLINIGLSGPGATPLVADYVKNKSRGLATAYIGLMAGIGVIFGVFVLFGMTKELPYKQSYVIVALYTMSIALFLLFGVKDLNIEKKHVLNMPLKDKISIKYD